MATVEFSKEMVDLLTKVKRHLRDKYQISISLADPQVLERLLEVRHINDPLLQGMIRYLMALAGGDWSRRHEGKGSGAEPNPPLPGVKQAKKMFGLYRGSTVDATGQSPADGGQLPPADRKKPVRYYRGQPVYDE